MQDSTDYADGSVEQSESLVDESDSSDDDDDEAPVDFRAVLPSWSYSPEVAEYADGQDDVGRLASMQASVGPGIKLAWMALAVFWIPLISVTLLFHGIWATCDGDQHQLVRMILLVPMLFRLIVEFRCFRYVIIPYIQTVKAFRVGPLTLPFCIYFPGFASLSAVCLFGQVTKSCFVILAQEKKLCLDQSMHAEHLAELIWNASMHKLSLGWFQFRHYADAAFFIWMLSWFQALYPIYQSMPRCWRQEDVEFQVGSRNTKFKNLVGHTVNFGDNLYSLAQATSMMTLVAHQPTYPRARERHHRNRTKREGGYQAEESLKFLEAALADGIHTIVMVGALDNVPQVMLGSLIFSVLHARLHFSDSSDSPLQAPLDRATVLSVGISCLTCLTKLAKAFQLMSFSWEVTGEVKNVELTRKGRNALTRIRCLTINTAIFAIILLVGATYAFVQIVGTAICENGEGRIWLPTFGCLRIQDVIEEFLKAQKSL